MTSACFLKAYLSLKLQVQSIQVTGDVSQKIQLVLLFAVQDGVNLCALGPRRKLHVAAS